MPTAVLIEYIPIIPIKGKHVHFLQTGNRKYNYVIQRNMKACNRKMQDLKTEGLNSHYSHY